MTIRILFLLLVAGVFGVRAEATAVASVKEAVWQTDFAYYWDPLTNSQTTSLPAGVTLACTGTAQADGNGGCTDKRGASATSSNGALVKQIVDTIGGVQLHNTAAADYAGTFAFTTKFSAFNPSGPAAGIWVDDPAVEYAAFFTVVRGPGAYDLHGCDLLHGGAAGAIGGKHTCDVSAPFDWGQALLGPLAAGGTTAADYQIYIDVRALGIDPPSVPEPPVIWLFVSSALLMLVGMRRARR